MTGQVPGDTRLADDCDAIEERAKLPRGVVVISFLFILLGAFAGFTMIVGVFSDAFYINPYVLLLPVGINLLRFRQGARSCAGSILIVMLLLSAFGMLLFGFASEPNFLMLRGMRILSVPRVFSVLVLIVCILLALWMIRAMDRPEVDRLFMAGKAKRFNLSRGAWITIVVALALALILSAAGQYVVRRANPSDVYGSIANEKGLWAINHGCRFGKLSYVVFQHNPDGPSIASIVHGDSRGPSLRLPDGTATALPTENQLLEYDGSILVRSDERVTKEQFEAFMASYPDEYTIQALLSFAKNTDGSQ